MTVITRFAPSPTGFLHIGSARTALFNYLFAKKNQGKFFLRIEDTDQERSTQIAKDAILSGLKWLNIDWDEDIVYQSQRQARHAQIASYLVKIGKAYYCFCSKEEIENKKNTALKSKNSILFKSPWRDVNPSDYPKDIKPTIRLKVSQEGQTTIPDVVQGMVTIENQYIEDLVLLRSDGTPTYMLAVVVDDNDMKITHIIRGDDHLTNTAKQMLIYQALNWKIPIMAHIPLIHGIDGNKLSKRHGALGVEKYKELGYLPEALCNYLLRLGWGHGNEEIISREQAITLFNLEGLGKSPARLNFTKINSLNSYYIKQANEDRLTNLVIEILKETPNNIIDEEIISFIKKGMSSFKVRALSLHDLATQSQIYLIRNKIKYDNDALNAIQHCNIELIKEIIDLIKNNTDNLQQCFKNFANTKNIELSKIITPIRALLTGKTTSPSIFEIIIILGNKYTIERLECIYDYK